MWLSTTRWLPPWTKYIGVRYLWHHESELWRWWTSCPFTWTHILPRHKSSWTIWVSSPTYTWRTVTRLFTVYGLGRKGDNRGQLREPITSLILRSTPVAKRRLPGAQHSWGEVSLLQETCLPDLEEEILPRLQQNVFILQCRQQHIQTRA